MPRLRQPAGAQRERAAAARGLTICVRSLFIYNLVPVSLRLAVLRVKSARERLAAIFSPRFGLSLIVICEALAACSLEPMGASRQL